MADWTSIANTTLEPDAPLTSATMLALRDNPEAITEGAAGAPRVVDGALSTNATNTGRDWVLNRTALAQLGSVGTYAMMKIDRDQDAGFTPGDTVSASALRYGGVNNDGPVSATTVTPSGTWRLMGFARGVAGAGVNPAVSLWLRIS